MASNVTIVKATGLNTQPNELALPPGSLAVAENVEITRDDIIEVSRGFEDFSSNLPDFTPAQLISIGGVAYLHLDNGIWYYNGTNWLRKRGTFGAKATNPYYCVVVSGHLYYTANSCVWDMNLSTGGLSVLAGRFGANATTNGTGAAARFNVPTGVCSDGTNLFVCEQSGCTVRKIVISSAVVTTLAGNAGVPGSADGTGVAAEFNGPVGVCTDNTNLFVVDSDNHTIRKIVISSGVVTTFAGTAGATGTTDATGAAARFNTPQGICTDNTSLFVADYLNNTVRKIVISSAVVTTLASGLAAPTGIATDNTNLFVCQVSQPAIKKIVISSGVVTTFAGTLSTGSADGIGTAASFSNPQGLHATSTELHVCDYDNRLIRKVYVSTQYVSTISGVPGTVAATTPHPFADGIFAGPP